MNNTEISILVLGFAGQALFFMRFFVQWLQSEKHQKSVIPVSFWYFSLAGSSLLMVYAILRHDIVFIVGQSTGFYIYLRNLYFIHREKKEAPEPA
ncbi:MAG: lipid A biosynthesis acyltransferase [Desulfuromonadaceae bacterium GWC2_58_13]|nr:MAG: lipid A biosynthesis acyltransferase [Desulfuromonadaceae bacterium GWC2_58_13]